MQNGLAVSWVLPVLRIALLVPILDAATTALICGAIWLNRDRRMSERTPGSVVTPPLAALAGVLGQIVPSLGFNLLGSQILALVWYGAAAAVLLLLLRLLVHSGLLERKLPRNPEARLSVHTAAVRCHRKLPSAPTAG